MMNRFTPWIASLVLFFLVAAPLRVAAEVAPPEPAPQHDRSPAAPFAQTIATVTGIAISPLLGTGALGAYQYATATEAERERLPWFAQWKFFLPALLIAGACAAKDAFGLALPPGLKKPMDVLETLENQLSGLVAAGAVVPITMHSLSQMIVGGGSAAAPIALPTGTATVALGAFEWSWLLNILTVPLGLAIFAVVWLASHAINALILLSPWAAIDAALKSIRTALLGLIVVTATFSPWTSLLLSLVIIVVAYLVAGWAFRLTVFGSVFSWDFLTQRQRRFRVSEQGENLLFSSNTLAKQGVPMRTYGCLRVEPSTGKLSFRYRPWLVMPERTHEVTITEPAVGKGLFISSIQDGERTAFVLPPRYRGHEELVARLYGPGGGVRDAGLLKAWGTFRELFGGSSARTQVT